MTLTDPPQRPQTSISTEKTRFRRCYHAPAPESYPIKRVRLSSRDAQQVKLLPFPVRRLQGVNHVAGGTL